MTDMAPRRMDGFARPAARPTGSGLSPTQRPTAPVRPQPQPGSRPAGRAPARPSAAPGQVSAPAPAQAKPGRWKVVLQFVIGLVVIAVVAGAIVWLYITYYTQ